MASASLLRGKSLFRRDERQIGLRTDLLVPPRRRWWDGGCNRSPDARLRNHTLDGTPVLHSEELTTPEKASDEIDGTNRWPRLHLGGAAACETICRGEAGIRVKRTRRGLSFSTHARDACCGGANTPGPSGRALCCGARPQPDVSLIPPFLPVRSADGLVFDSSSK
ncbi:hypothetical protein GN956_G25344 [Arapaima gigas]